MEIAKLLAELEASYSKAMLDCGHGLHPPASEEDIRQIEVTLATPVPAELRDVLRIHGGQDQIGSGTTGLFGQHRLHSPREIIERYRDSLENHLLFPLDRADEFPPKTGEWGYWNPSLVPFASWDCYELCIHSQRGDVWEFDPHIGLTLHRPSIASILREVIDAIAVGKKAELEPTGHHDR